MYRSVWARSVEPRKEVIRLWRSALSGADAKHLPAILQVLSSYNINLTHACSLECLSHWRPVQVANGLTANRRVAQKAKYTDRLGSKVPAVP
jgi:hypothetical protein